MSINFGSANITSIGDLTSTGTLTANTGIIGSTNGLDNIYYTVQRFSSIPLTPSFTVTHTFNINGSPTFSSTMVEITADGLTNGNGSSLRHSAFHLTKSGSGNLTSGQLYTYTNGAPPTFTFANATATSIDLRVSSSATSTWDGGIAIKLYNLTGQANSYWYIS